MKLIGETRFDVGDEDAELHGVPVEERYGLALVFACDPEGRAALKQWAETLTDPRKNMVLINSAEFRELKNMAAEMKRLATEVPRRLFDIPGVRVIKYNIESSQRYDRFAMGMRPRETSFRDMGARFLIEVETMDPLAAQELDELLRRNER